MPGLRTLLAEYGDKRIALYGLGTETERFLSVWGNELSVVGLLDGFREDGELYGYPIIPLQKAFSEGVRLIIVVARPGSCKAIAKRIGDLCREHAVSLFDVRGNDLLVTQKVSYDFGAFSGDSKAALLEKIARAEVISFDLFDTLIMRKVFTYTDIFDILALRLREQGVSIPDFARLRLSSEKERSKAHAPTLTEIYEDVLQRSGGCVRSAEELAKLEWELDRTLLLPRHAVCEIYRDVVRRGKRVVITTDSYYSETQVREILSSFQLEGHENVLVSCEKGTAKTGKLFEELCADNGGNAQKILHIGDDAAADIVCAEKYGIETYRVYSGADLFDLLGGLGTEKEIETLSDRVKAGLFISRMFHDPFVFEAGDRRLSVADTFDIGYLFCAPILTDFLAWLRDRVEQERIPQMLFCARDGFLLEQLYRRLDPKTKTVYFLTSRMAAIRAGVADDGDISYVDSMKFFGTPEEGLRVRFGIEKADIEDGRNDVILRRADVYRRNYRKYIDTLGLADADAAMFDFVAKGTTQLYLRKLFRQHLKGFYFLWLEPEFMTDKGLDIEPFYAEEEKNASAVFDNYYILETILTSPEPMTVAFDEDGRPVFAKETRSARDLRCIRRAQDGIVSYFEDYIRILPESERKPNKRLDEVFLSLFDQVRITDQDFMSLTVEDPFFGRMTAMADVVG